MLTLWHCENARSFRPLWALEELGLDYALNMLPFPPRFQQPAFLEQNPLGTIPLLVDGDTRMTESAAIPHYLGMVHGQGRFTLGAEHPEYGAYLNWLHHAEATLTFPQTIYLRYGVFEPDERKMPSVAADYRRWFLVRLKLLEARLQDGRAFLVGGQFTMADIAVHYALYLAARIGMRDELPRACRQWHDALCARAGFQAAVKRQSLEAKRQNLRSAI
ncbi:glutathione S-transferase family protein [Thalassobius sp. S69A]|uniref:glutathione S-transferase family protein n=1 Tax=unclassified Thalassovita TaxID=2619711 RepID=UPI000C0CB662|nr:glutathione S-transferase [Paracoccaceae bacterium]MBT26612.1 glutathione S-transferase [Paracoccaceae bacterium]